VCVCVCVCVCIQIYIYIYVCYALAGNRLALAAVIENAFPYVEVCIVCNIFIFIFIHVYSF